MNILNKNKTTKWMINFAWILEILLCLSGILVAFTLSYIGVTGESNNLAFDTKLILLIGTLPLIGVALTELLKIPLATGFLYARSWMIKGLAGTALVAICILTFETMLTGQEQLFSLRAEQIKLHKQDENRLVEKIKLIDSQIISISGLTPSEIKKEANAGLQAQLSAINEQIDDLRKRESDLISSNKSAEANELLRQVKQLEDNKNQIIKEHRKDLDSFDKEILSINKDEQTELANTAIFKTRISEKYANRRDLIETRRRDNISVFNNETSDINSRINYLNSKIAKINEPSEVLKSNLALIAQQIIDLQNEKNEIIKSNNKIVETNVLEAKASKASIDTLKEDKMQLIEELNLVRDNLAISSGDSFMHRLAALFYGVENLADLTEEQLGTIAIIFMCSVAGVGSIAGPIITFVAVSIQMESIKKPSKKKSKILRVIAIALIRKIRKPRVIKEVIETEIEREVIKEVPIEKIVHKEVEVPKPVEIPLFVQVPVPTDPKDLPKMEEVTSEQMRPISSIGGIN